MEKVKLSDALVYLKSKTGIDFERKAFIRYLEAGEVRVGACRVPLFALRIEGRWFVDRSCLDDLVNVINGSD